MKTKIALGILLAVAVMPSLAFAGTVKSNVWNISILNGPLVTCWGAPVLTDTTGNETPNGNACTSVCDLVDTVANVIYFGIGVVIWIITPIMFAISGIMFMISRGNPEGTSQAKKMITGTVIGLLVVICAYIIVYTFVNVLGIAGSIGGFGGPACSLQ